MNEQPLRVLLVDDDRELCEELADLLREQYSYVVDTAADGSRAWERVIHAERPYHVALIDDL